MPKLDPGLTLKKTPDHDQDLYNIYAIIFFLRITGIEDRSGLIPEHSSLLPDDGNKHYTIPASSNQQPQALHHISDLDNIDMNPPPRISHDNVMARTLGQVKLSDPAKGSNRAVINDMKGICEIKLVSHQQEDHGKAGVILSKILWRGGGGEGRRGRGSKK